ncbi:hypothetical protein H4R24_002412 [Coemansia sp. RSA 988]|nr:hypothetical protein H4R24_002412 [Coemansia sp. RSA 988]
MTKAQISEYEQQRLETIRQNRELLLSLNLVGENAINVFEEGATTRKIVLHNTKKRRPSAKAKQDSDDDAEEWRGDQIRTRRSTTTEPARRSKRLRGESAEPTTAAEEHVIETGDISAVLAPAETHFSEVVIKSAIRVSGHYSGWVEPETMARLGLSSNATEAWESQGGGKFSFKDPLGTGKKLSKRTVPSGQSMAKYVASKLLKKNPNAYFYRHTEPGVEQWTGDWTNEERDIFLTVAKEFGCGDKWGLFSTYIPHRVGYQCSNYYRQYVIPSGWIIDENYRIDSAGGAIYVGTHKRGGR